MRRILLLAFTFIALLLFGSTLIEAAGVHNPRATLTCEAWATHPLTSAIDSDLSHWSASGITREGMEATLKDYASPKSRLPVAGVGVLVAGAARNWCCCNISVLQI